VTIGDFSVHFYTARTVIGLLTKIRGINVRAFQHQLATSIISAFYRRNTVYCVIVHFIFVILSKCVHFDVQIVDD